MKENQKLNDSATQYEYFTLILYVHTYLYIRAQSRRCGNDIQQEVEIVKGEKRAKLLRKRIRKKKETTQEVVERKCVGVKSRC